jgi:hypothetical protein
MSSTVKEALGAHHAKTYTSIAAMMVECAAPYTAAGLMLISAYSAHHPLQYPMLSTVNQMVVSANVAYDRHSELTFTFQCISPELIMWRVATGRAWGGNTAAMSTRGVIHDRPGANVGHSATQISELRFKQVVTDSNVLDAEQSKTVSLNAV